MASKIFYFSFVIVLTNFHSYVDSRADFYPFGDRRAEGICNAPPWLPGNPATERIHIDDVSGYSQSFLSGLTTLPAVCAKDNLVYRLEVEEPSEDDAVMNAARKAVGETSPEDVIAAKAKLVELLKRDTKMKVPLDNDAWLIRFLRLRKYNTMAAFNLIKDYYTFRFQNRRNLYRDLVPSRMSKVAENNAISVLPNRDQLGRRILVVRTKNWKPKLNSLIEEWKVGVVLTEAAAYEPATQLAGIQVIIDASGMTLGHIRQFNPFIAKKVIEWVLRAAPFKYGGIHIVKQPRIFWAAFAVFKPLLTANLKQKIFFHGNDMKSLHRQINPSHLPAEYGGSLPSTGFSSYEWKVTLESFDTEFAKIDSYGLRKK